MQETHKVTARWTSHSTARNGLRLCIRPLRPDDRAREVEFINSLSERTRFYRLMTPLKFLPPHLLDRLMDVDYDRRMAFVATVEQEGREQFVGIARYGETDRPDAVELGVTVTDRWQRHGIARLLIAELVRFAGEEPRVPCPARLRTARRRHLEAIRTGGIMSETSRREFIAGVTKLAGVSAAATVAGGAPAVALGAIRERAGKSAITTPANAIVETAAGKVRGYVRSGIFTFKGIPYAGTTAGEGRFLPPAPVTPWTQVRASMSYGPVCPQPVRTGWASDRLAFLFDWDDGHPGEDCLRLNVWTPAADDRSKRPVMVWLHGGGYEAGSSQELPSYDGENLSRRGDVVVVSVNHRLNVFGYLNMAAAGGEKYARSVNVGMLDIVAALQWVRDNVGRFGGDAANVTIFGQSGGAAKVNTLMAMPAAKGLFHKAIAQSGSQLRLATADASAAQAEAVLKELEAQGIGRGQLTQVPAARLVEIATVAKNRLVSTKPRAPTHERLGWQPWLDGSVVTSHPFDPQASPLAANLPMMIGTTMHEFSPAGAMPDPRSLTKEWLVAEVTKSYGDAAAGVVATFERGHPGALPYELAGIISATTVFRNSAVRQAQLQSVNAPAYLYWFAWKTPVLDGTPLAYHCAELAFAFDNIDRCANSTGGTQEARELAAKVSQAWIQFARTGNPNHSGLPSWPAVSASTLPTMIFDTRCEVRNDPDAEERAALG